jgi:hypothetical protein
MTKIEKAWRALQAARQNVRTAEKLAAETRGVLQDLMEGRSTYRLSTGRQLYRRLTERRTYTIDRDCAEGLTPSQRRALGVELREQVIEQWDERAREREQVVLPAPFGPRRRRKEK